MKWARNKPDAAKPAIVRLPSTGRHWREVGDPARYALRARRLAARLLSCLSENPAHRTRSGCLRLLTILALGLVACGCVGDGRRCSWTPSPGLEDQGEVVRRAQRTMAALFPSQYRAAHRAILTVGHKQFVCDGHLTVSTNTGWHLAVVSPLGLVAEVRVRRDGTRELLKVTPLLRAAWSRDFMARDLQWLFVPPGELQPAGRLADGRLVFEKTAGADGVLARYVFSSAGDQWQALELWRKGRRLYRATPTAFRQSAGWPVASPSEIDVEAERYHLHLRVVDLRVAAEAGP